MTGSEPLQVGLVPRGWVDEICLQPGPGLEPISQATLELRGNAKHSDIARGRRDWAAGPAFVHPFPNPGVFVRGRGV